MLYKILMYPYRVWFKLRTKLTVVGSENIPEGPVIFVGNHTGVLDTFVFPTAIEAEMAAFVAWKYRFVPIFWPFMLIKKVILIKRGRRNYESLYLALKMLLKGLKVFIFPEGTRGGSESLTQGKYGVGFLAHQSRASIIPAVAIGTYNKFWQFFIPWLPRIEVQVIIGKPFKFEMPDDFVFVELDDDTKDLYQKEVENQVMVRIADLLPEHMKGVYA